MPPPRVRIRGDFMVADLDDLGMRAARITEDDAPLQEDSPFPADGSGSSCRSGSGNELSAGYQSHDGAAEGQDDPEWDDIVQHVDLFETAEDWLSHSMLGEQELASINILEVTDDGQVFIMMPRYSVELRQLGREVMATGERQRVRRLNPFAFLTIRPIAFSDGIALCSSCNNPGCDRTAEDAALFDRELEYPEQQHQRYAAVFGDQPSMCRCACTAVSACLGLDAAACNATVLSGDALATNNAWEWYQTQDPFRALFRRL